METKTKLSLSYFVATLGILFFTIGFVNEFLEDADRYKSVDSEEARDAYFQVCVASMDETYSVENEECQRAVNERVLNAMFDFIVSGLQVLGGILLWVGISGIKISLMKVINIEQNDISAINKKIKKINNRISRELEPES